MKRKVLQGKEAREKLMKGVNLVADVVGKTMGSNGKTVMVSDGRDTIPWVTKDGISVAASIRSEDEIENVGVMAMKNIGDKTVIEAGDGTTQTIVLGRAMLKEGYAKIDQGAQSQSVKRGMDKAVSIVVDKVKELSEPISHDDEKLLSVASISANNDPEIGGLIANAYSRIGPSGLLSIEYSKTAKTYTEVVDGFEFDRGYQHAGYVNVPEKMQAVYENPLILVADYDLITLKSIGEILKPMLESEKPIIIIAKGIEGEVFQTLLSNKAQHGVNVCTIKAPNRYQEECLSDIAVMTGATLITDKIGLKLESIKMEHLGTCSKIIVSNDTTKIIEGKGDKDKIKAREEEVSVLLEQSDDSLVKDEHRKRLAQLTSSIGVIYVGASGDLEAKEKLDRVDDAVRASKSAIEEGICSGGGVTLLRCISSLYSVKCDNEDEQDGVDVIRMALEVPARQILKNAEVYQNKYIRLLSNLVGTTLENPMIKKIKAEKGDIGYNVKTMKMENLKEAGVIDPSKVIRVALQNANSMAGSMITSDSLIVDVLEKNG